MTSPTIQKEINELLTALHDMETKTSGINLIMVPKKGIFSFGREKTVYRGSDEKLHRIEPLAAKIRFIASQINYLIKDPVQRKEAKLALANITRNVKEAEEDLMLTQKKPTRTQKARIKSCAKILAKLNKD